MRLPSLSWIVLVLLAWMPLGVSCTTVRPSQNEVSPEAWTRWKQRRLESIAGTNGWATLVGLIWIPQGRSVLGSDPSAALRLPTGRAPGKVGTLIRTRNRVEFQGEAGIPPRLLHPPAPSSDSPAELRVGDLRMFVIVRGDRLALRVKDPQAPTRVHFQGLDYFPYSIAWKIQGRWEPAARGRTVSLADVTGSTQSIPSAGIVRFQVQGKELSLEAVEDDETHDLWFIFRDRTSASTTYGGGRFLHADKPTADGSVILDFNYAYNPPCAFTPFATCPTPPRQNRVNIPIPAGERRYAGPHASSASP